MIESGRADGPVVLLVDDDPGVLESQADLLRKECRVIATSDVREAMALLEGGEVALVLSDQRMPGMSGTDLLARAASLSPSTVRVLLTAYSDIEAVIQAINKGHVFYYFTKPWDPERLLEIVRAALETHRLLVERRTLLAHLERVARGEAAASMPRASDDVERLRLDNELLSRSLAQVEQSFGHLRRIQEVVPVCLKCGKIKTGDARWEAVVDYLRQNSSFLSHGYCPECTKQVRVEWGLSSAEPPVEVLAREEED